MFEYFFFWLEKMLHHRMGSYYGSGSQSGGSPAPSIISTRSSGVKKGILVPPAPPPTSTIPSKGQRNPVVPNGTGRGLSQLSPSSQLLRFESEDMLQIQALNRRLASLTIADMSSDLALQRILLLHRRGDHREAAGFIRRLSYPTFRQLMEDLPMEGFVEAMPQSLPILEAIYGKLFVGSETWSGLKAVSGDFNNKYSAENVVWQIVKFFASQDITGSPNGDQAASKARWEMCGPWASTCKRLLSLLLTAEPRVKHLILERRKCLTKAIEGLGQHGLIGTSDESLLHLHDALKGQFENTCRAYSEALTKLEQLCLTTSSQTTPSMTSSTQLNSIINNFNGKLLLIKANSSGSNQSGSNQLLKSPPVAQSHQRQLSLRVNEIQERLIRNKKPSQCHWTNSGKPQPWGPPWHPSKEDPDWQGSAVPIHSVEKGQWQWWSESCKWKEFESQCCTGAYEISERLSAGKIDWLLIKMKGVESFIRGDFLGKGGMCIVYLSSFFLGKRRSGHQTSPFLQITEAWIIFQVHQNDRQIFSNQSKCPVNHMGKQMAWNLDLAME